MTEKVKEIDPLRNAALSGSEAYHAKSSQSKVFDVKVKVKKIIDEMPIFSKPVATKLAERMVDKVNQSISSSIWGKIKQQDAMTLGDMIKYCKEQKHDKLFGVLVFICTYLLTLENVTVLPELSQTQRRQ